MHIEYIILTSHYSERMCVSCILGTLRKNSHTATNNKVKKILHKLLQNLNSSCGNNHF